MTITVYALAIDTFAPMLNTLSALLDKGAAHARPGTLAGARLAPDMFPLSTQVQLACHNAKDATAHLTGETPPTHSDPRPYHAERRQALPRG
jgi:hypothetical protein